MVIDNKSETDINVNILLNDIFSDLGLPHYFLALSVKKVTIDSNRIVFNCLTFDNKLDIYSDDVELIPIQKFDIYFDIIQDHNIKITCDIDLIDNHNIPSFSEKMIGHIIYNIFNRLKQFIENASF